MNHLADPAAERAVLAGICKHGSNCYFDIADILGPNTFTIDSNCVIYKCLKKIYTDDANAIIDLALIRSAAHQIGLSHIVEQPDELKHLQAIMKFPVEQTNVGKFAAKIRKLEIGRLCYDKLEEIKGTLLDIKGDESITSILSLVEEPIFDFATLFNDVQNDPELIGEDLDEFLKDLVDNQVEQVGFSTGYPLYDRAIGGGLRRGTFNLVGARTKCGKSIMLENIGIHIASVLNLPVLYLDTEMNREDHRYRMFGMMSEVPVNDIETGKFAKSSHDTAAVKKQANKIKNMRYWYENISGRPFEEQLAIMRRWLVKEVGFRADGTANDCVIIYDYLKLMSSEGLGSDMKEYQMLGFQTTGLHNFAARYQLPIMSAIQLNRDGINKESTEAASGSDRIVWLCSNFSILKKKSDEEIAADGIQNGNRKLVPIACRHGAGLDEGDYINMTIKKDCLKLVEGKLRSELGRSSVQQDGFMKKDDNDDEIPFDG